MPRTGRPPKPIELKRLLGNPGKRPLPKAPITALAPVEHIEVGPAALNGHELIQSILDAGASTWVGPTDRLGLLELVADGWDERKWLRALLAAEGYSDRYSKPRPEVGRLTALEKQLTSWLSLLGLSPTDRSRLGVAEVKARTKLEELADRRASRVGRPAI